MITNHSVTIETKMLWRFFFCLACFLSKAKLNFLIVPWSNLDLISVHTVSSSRWSCSPPPPCPHPRRSSRRHRWPCCRPRRTPRSRTLRSWTPSPPPPATITTGLASSGLLDSLHSLPLLPGIGIEVAKTFAKISIKVNNT